MFREFRRKSLQLEFGALDKFRSDRRGSLSDRNLGVSGGGLNLGDQPHTHSTSGYNLSHNIHPEKEHRRGSLVAR